MPRATAAELGLPHPAAGARTAARDDGYALAAYAALAVAVRIVCITRWRIDSDEPQHLHVTWWWSQGLVAYRDFYDNHTPLFHLLLAPFVRAAGETPDILLVARLMMLPFAVVALALAWWIAERLYDRQVAIWTVIGSSVFPYFVLKLGEFRNDNVWVIFTLASIALVLEPLTPRRAAVLGLILGLSFLASLKTIFLVIGLGVVLLVVDRIRPMIVLAAATGAAIPLATGALWLLHHDALREFWWCNVWMNSQKPIAPERRAMAVMLFAAAVTLVVRQLRRNGHLLRGRRVAAAVAVVFLFSIPVITPLVGEREILPLIPLFVMFLFARLGATAVRATVIVFIVATVVEGRLWREPDPYPQALVREALVLTRANERVLDLKGETIFRQRGSYVALETVSRDALRFGAVPETFAGDVVRQRVYVATRDADFFPPRTRKFLNDHFLRVGVMRVAGSRVSNGVFRIAVAGPYVTLGPGRTILQAATWYEPGLYRAKAGAVCVVWKCAIERGFWPSGQHHQAHADRAGRAGTLKLARAQ